MKLKTALVILLVQFYCMRILAQPPLVYNKENTGAQYALSFLPAIEQALVIDPLPDPFAWAGGKGRSTRFSDWERRRNEIKAEIEHYEIGTKPVRPSSITATYSAADSSLKVVVTVNGKTLTLTSQVILPQGKGPFPGVIGMNSANGSLPADIFTSRNIARIRFSHNQVTTYNAPKNTDPFYQLYPELSGASGQYSAWAWGVSRLIDGLELVQASLLIDLKHLAVTGCSYAGKMALFAGAFDERIALTIPQESGGGGAPAWRVSETMGDVEKLGMTSHQWFKSSMFQYAGLNVSRLPYDHHELMAMVAPRALLVTANTDYNWLSNQAAYVSARATREIYRALGVSDRMGFYIDGGHGHCAIPTSQRPAIEAFVDKFLLGKSVNTDTVTINPYPNVDYQTWYQWWGTGKPFFAPFARKADQWLEAECGTAGASWQKVTDPLASGGTYLNVRNSSPSIQRAPLDTVTNNLIISFTLASESDYNFLAKIYASNGAHDSYWVKVDNSPFVRADGFTGGEGWQWGRMISMHIAAGKHMLVISCREDDAKPDKILITTSMQSSIPQPEPAGSNCLN